MKVILLEDVRNLGVKGDVVEVKPGYAKNALLPKGLATEATSNAINQRDLKVQANKRRKKEDLAEAQDAAEQINNKKIEIPVKAGENGKLFGSVTNKEIGKEIEKQLNQKIDRKKITLSEPIRALGTYQVSIKIHPKVIANISVVLTELK